MKVLHLLNTNTYSGAENVVCTIIKNMGKECEMIYCSPNGEIRDKLLKENIPFYPLKRLSYKEIKSAVSELKPDIIHAHDNRATVMASFFNKKVKVISHIHGNNQIMKSLNVKTILFNSCSKRVEKYIWVSESSLKDYYFNKRIKNKSIVLYNVVDAKQIENKSREYQCNQKYDIIYLGRLEYPKNPQKFIEIVNIIKNRKKDIKVAMVGDGKDRKEIEKIIENYNLGNNITMYGYLENPYPILKKSKIMIMTSVYEGTPMSALEAQILGKPIVATPVDGLRKIVINGYNGFLSENESEMAEKVIELLKNENVYKKNCNNSLKNATDICNIKKYLKIIKSIYEEVDKKGIKE